MSTPVALVLSEGRGDSEGTAIRRRKKKAKKQTKTKKRAESPAAPPNIYRKQEE